MAPEAETEGGDILMECWDVFNKYLNTDFYDIPIIFHTR